MTPPRYLQLVRASALYDLLVSAPFATPWTASLVLSALAQLHLALGLAGPAMPAFAPFHLLFVAFFGTVVTMWALLRLIWPRREQGLIDGAGRLAFSAWQAWALFRGASPLLWGFLLVELAFGATQLLGLRRTRTDALAAAAIA